MDIDLYKCGYGEKGAAEGINYFDKIEYGLHK
jgi:hypothetical protein